MSTSTRELLVKTEGKYNTLDIYIKATHQEGAEYWSFPSLNSSTLREAL